MADDFMDWDLEYFDAANVYVGLAVSSYDANAIGQPQRVT